MDMQQGDKTTLRFEIALRKKKPHEADLFTFGGRMWVYFRSILSLLASKFRPTLKFDPDVIGGRFPMVAQVGVYFVPNQSVDYDYAGFGEDLVQIYAFVILALQKDAFITQPLTHFLSTMLERREVGPLTAAERVEIDDYEKKITKLIKKYRERVEVSIKVIPQKNISQINGGDLDINTENPDDDNPATYQPPFQPTLPNLPGVLSVNKPIRIKNLDEIYTGRLASLATMSGIESMFLIDGNSVEYNIEYLNWLQIIENIKLYMGKELSIKVKIEKNGKKIAYVYEKNNMDK